MSELTFSISGGRRSMLESRDALATRPLHGLRPRSDMTAAGSLPRKASHDIAYSMLLLPCYEAQRRRFAAPHAQRSELKASVNNALLACNHSPTTGVDE